jgi:arabinofuranan 3-O-arabinosyltransferase
MTLLASAAPAGTAPAGTAGAPPPPRVRKSDRTPIWVILVAAAVVIALCFLQDPGRLAPDTKLALVVNPIGLLAKGLHIWDPTSGFGVVQEDQVLGYMVPMGPFFALGQLATLPMWMLQRVWFGLLLAAAMAGTVRLADELGIGRPITRLAAGLAFALSPDVLALLGGVSAEVLPSALLPWVLLPLVKGSRGGSVATAAARSGVAVALIGGINAGATLAILPLPALFLLTRTRGRRRRSLIRWWALSVTAAIAWWLIPLLIDSSYSYNFLAYIERAANTTSTTSAPAVLGGMADWVGYFFSGGKPLWQGAWLLVAAPAAVLTSAGLAAAGMAGLAHRRFLERRFLVLGLLVGLAAMTAGYVGPLGGPFSSATRDLLNGVLVAFRNVYKFEPLVQLPLALGLAHGLATVRWRRPEQPIAAAVVVVMLAGTALPLLLGKLIPAGSFSAVPSYWYETADWLAAHAHGKRTLLLPDSGFPDYYWGTPTDEPFEALAASPWAVRSQVPLGSSGVVRLMDAVEARLSTRDPSVGLAPFLARAGVGFLVVRNDLSWIAAAAANPAQVRATLLGSPGIREIAAFGPVISPALTGNEPSPPAPIDGTGFRAVDIYQVSGTSSPAVLYPASHYTIVSGGPGSLLQLADSGQLGGSVILAGDPTTGLGPDARWADTDGNRRQGDDFGLANGGLSYTLGATETLPGGTKPRDRAAVAGVAHQTVAIIQGAVSVSASSYATALAPHPENLPYAAFDGDPATAWESGSAGSSDGQWVEITLPRPRSFPHVTVSLLGPSSGPHATELGLSTDSGALVVPLADTTAPQVLPLPPGPTRRLRVTLLDVVGENLSSFSRAGLATVDLPGVTVTRLLSVPTDELSTFSSPSKPPPLYIFNRTRVDPDQLLRTSPEPGLDRRFVVPHAAKFQLGGLARFRSGQLSRHAGCGSGPVVTLDGHPIATSLNGSVVGGQLAFSACTTLSLSAGAHLVETPAQAALAVDSMTLTGVAWPATVTNPSRSLSIRSWDTTHRVVSVGAGPSVVLATTENFNHGWSATLDGHTLQPLTLDGWRQAWVVPAGAAGTITLEFGADHAYRISLLLSLLALAGLVLVALGLGGAARRTRRGRHRLERRPGRLHWLPALPGDRGSHSRRVLLPGLAQAPCSVAASVVAGACLIAAGGPLALVTPAVLWLTGWFDAAPVVAGVAFAAAGLVETLQPGALPASHIGAFGAPAQLAALVATGAMAVSILDLRGSKARMKLFRLPRAGLAGDGQEDGRDRGTVGEEPIKPAGCKGDIVVGGTGKGHRGEAVGREHLDQGAGGEQSQVADHQAAGPAEDAESAHLGEHRLDPSEQQQPVEPGGKVGGGAQEAPPGDQDPPDLVQHQVRVEEVLDHLAHDDHVEVGANKGEEGSIDAGTHDDQAPGPGAGD